MNLSFKSYWNLLSDHIRPQKRRFILLAVLLFGSIGLRIIAPQIMRSFIDSALAGEALKTLTWTAVAFIGIALIQQVVAVIVKYLGENVAWTSLITVDFTSLAVRASGKNSPSSLSASSTISVLDLSTRFFEELTTSSI